MAAAVTFIGLVRGVNVGGHNRVAMADLRALLQRLGFTDVRTLLQSGNVVFRGAARSTAALERLLETEMAKRMGLQPDWHVRTAAEWSGIVARNPFPDVARRDPARFVLMLLREAPSARAVKALQAAIAGPEQVRSHGNELYATFPAGQGTSKLTITVIEKALGTSATGRNWNTVLKLLEASRAQE